MKKTNQRVSNTNVVMGVAKNISAIRACKSDTSQVTDKPDRHISRVKFKENVGKGKAVKNVQFVRNTTVPVKKTPSSVNFTPCIEEQLENDNKIPDNPEFSVEDDVENATVKVKLDVPELCTSLKFANKLLDEAVSKNKSVLQLNSHENASTSNAAKIKVLRKVNFPFDEPIFKDLVDLRVTENDLFPDLEKRYKPKQFVVRNKEKEPDLADFYKPAFDEEFVVKPNRPKVEPEKVVHYNGFTISDRMKRWESL